MEVEEIEWNKPRGYQDLIEAVSHYNTSLTVERAVGCPYVDGQTGIAMVSTDMIRLCCDVILYPNLSRSQPTTCLGLSTTVCLASNQARCTAISGETGWYSTRSPPYWTSGVGRRESLTTPAQIPITQIGMLLTLTCLPPPRH